MKLAIMQPYFFPYIGYFQVIKAVDAFVVYDDVNFIKGGWINRNFILSQGKRSRITLQLQGASPNLLINQIKLGSNRIKLLKTIQQSYSKATYFSYVYPMIEEILLYEEDNLSKFIDFGLRRICNYLGLSPKWYISSDLKKDSKLCGQNKVLSICTELGGSHYINASGGRSLYDKLAFSNQGVQLSFIASKDIEYPQFGGLFEPNLSIIDVLMFNDQEQCSRLLKSFDLD
ncbi:MAG: WbqC family protein [Candidatus Thiodiazotropha sp. (ex Myrtea spinifera)]|nr:WbqC family protein [Candidatus Thiodiazotropha sp. (ex Myrtea spinifera)]